MTPTPISPKVATGTASGALVIIIVWILSSCGIAMPPEVASALTVLVTALVGWATPDHLRSLGARYQERIVDYQARHAADDDGDHLDVIPATDATSDTKADAASVIPH